MMEDVKYSGLDFEDGAGPVKSVEGYIIFATNLNEEVPATFQLLTRRYRPKRRTCTTHSELSVRSRTCI